MFKSKIRNRILIIDLEGDLDMLLTVAFEKYIEDHVKGFDSLVLNMLNVDHISSATVGMLISLHKKGFKTYIILRKNTQLEVIFNLKGMDEIVKILHSWDDVNIVFEDQIDGTYIQH